MATVTVSPTMFNAILDDDAGLLAKVDGELIFMDHAHTQDKPRHGFLYIYAECSRLCPESSPKALLEPRTEG
jgi:hypothetical protein